MKETWIQINLLQFILYTAMGGLATGVDWFSFYLLNPVSGISYIPAVTVSFILGAITNYFLNKYLTFKDRTRQIVAQIGIYSVLCGFSLMCSIGLMYALVEWMKFWPMLARIFTTGIMLLLNFFMHKFITYNAQVYLWLKKAIF
jgi:putative flippase GtrA